MNNGVIDSNDLDELFYGKDSQSYYSEGFVDGTEDAFDRVIKVIKEELRRNASGHPTSVEVILEKVNKLKKRT